jgi:DNA-directed RNA polymerase specialized sigma24 family protein
MLTYEEAYKQYRGLIRWHIIRNLWDRQAVDDVEQEVWVAIFRSWSQYDQSRPFPPWARWFIYNARRRIIDKEIKEQEGRVAYLESLKGKVEGDAWEFAPDWLITHPTLYNLFVDRYIEGKRLVDIAEERDIQIHTLLRTHKRLKNLLRRYNERKQQG